MSEAERAKILKALGQVLESEKFAAAPQMSAFLRYVVEQAVDGNKKRIKAYTVAVDALGKPDSFDPQNDPVVRVLAGRLRASLTAYYEARPDVEVRILMKPGSYVPQFVKRDSSASEARVTAMQPLQSQTSVVSDNTGNTGHAPVADSHNAAMFSLLRSSLRFPVVGIGAVALAIATVFFTRSLVQNRTDNQMESLDQTPIQSVISAPMRARPDQVSLFVSTAENGNAFAERLNTIISGVFLESRDIHVYRILTGSAADHYWPEDYLISLDVIPLPTETRIGAELVDALTGRISHSTSLTLSKNAAESMTRQDFATITQFARQLIMQDGPLLQDYTLNKTPASVSAAAQD